MVSKRVLVAELITVKGFRPFGQVIFPQADDQPFGPEDAQLSLETGIPRFYIMQLAATGRHFQRITRHRACTQCLGALAGRDWWMAVAPASQAATPDLAKIRAFKIPGNCFIKLEVGTWHAGPYFEGTPINFYNLELSDTNLVDHDTCDLGATFEITV